MADDGDLAPNESLSTMQTTNILHSEKTNAVQAHTVSGGVHIHPPTIAPTPRFIRFVLTLILIAVVAIGAIAVRQWLPPISPNSDGGPPNQGNPPVPNPQLTSTIDDPCGLVLPPEVQQLYGLNVLGPMGKGPDPRIDSPLPDTARFTQDRTCSFPLAASAGELRIRMVDLADQTSTKDVFDQLRHQALDRVPDCGDECVQALGRFVARKANRVLLFVDVPSDLAGPRQISLEPLARHAVGRA